PEPCEPGTRGLALFDEVAPYREDDRMGPIGGSELRDEGLHALLHRVLGEDHRARDLLIGVALGEVTQELELAWREWLAHRHRSSRLRVIAFRLGRLLD